MNKMPNLLMCKAFWKTTDDGTWNGKGDIIYQEHKAFL